MSAAAPAFMFARVVSLTTTGKVATAIVRVPLHDLVVPGGARRQRRARAKKAPSPQADQPRERRVRAAPLSPLIFARAAPPVHGSPDRASDG